MDKEKIAEYVDNYISQFDKRLRARRVDDDLQLDITLEEGAATLAVFQNFKTDEFVILGLDDVLLIFQNKYLDEISRLILNKDILSRFYYRTLDAFEEFLDKKTRYTVSLSEDSKINYLNVDKTTGGFFFSTNYDNDNVRAYFTQTEIENMKNDPRFKAINFDKAVIEEVID